MSYGVVELAVAQHLVEQVPDLGMHRPQICSASFCDLKASALVTNLGSLKRSCNTQEPGLEVRVPRGAGEVLGVEALGALELRQ